MSLNNENNPAVTVIHLGSLDADAEIPAVYTNKKRRIQAVSLMNGAAIAASDTDFVELSLLDSDDNEIAELDTRAAGEGAVVAFVAKALNLTQEYVDAGKSLKVKYDETDSGTAVALTNASLCINWSAY